MRPRWYRDYQFRAFKGSSAPGVAAGDALDGGVRDAPPVRWLGGAALEEVGHQVGGGGAVVGVDVEPRPPVLDDLRGPAVARGEGGQPAGHGLHHGQAEGCGAAAAAGSRRQRVSRKHELGPSSSQQKQQKQQNKATNRNNKTQSWSSGGGGGAHLRRARAARTRPPGRPRSGRAPRCAPGSSGPPPTARTPPARAPRSGRASWRTRPPPRGPRWRRGQSRRPPAPG